MIHSIYVRAAIGLCLALAAQAAAARTITVAGITLMPCVAEYDGYCGSITRPLDPAGRVAGAIRIGFEFYPHTGSGKALGTIVAQEGGPGYSTTGSRDGYVRLFAPLRDRRDILLIDKRGTGLSGAIDCPALQRARTPDTARACAKQLGKTAWLYSSAYAADDVAAVLTALHTGPIDYYGDSYGTFFGQVFATRHPEMLRTMVLDSAYPVVAQDVYFQTEITHGPEMFALACERAGTCRRGEAKARFERLVAAVRTKPVMGRAPDSHGDLRKVTVGPGMLFTISANAGNSFTSYRDMDAAAPAYFDAGDAMPLLRLAAEATGGGASVASEFSVGLELAVICADYKQAYDMRSDEAARRAQFAASLKATAARDPKIYAPFTVQDSVDAPENPDRLDLCQAWPRAPEWATPGTPTAPGAKFPKTPVLVLNGELDTVTSPTEGKRAAALFPNATYLITPNTVHESAIGNGGYNVPPYGADLARCAGPIVLAFVASGGKRPDTACLQKIRPVRTVPKFALHWRDVAPAKALPGNAADAVRLKLVSAAAETVGDALARYSLATEDVGAGLRGGRFTVKQTKTGNLLTLTGAKWTSDLSVSGAVDWNQNTGAIVAKVTLGEHEGALTLTWNDRQVTAPTTIRGEIDGKAVVATRIAP